MLVTIPFDTKYVSMWHVTIKTTFGRNDVSGSPYPEMEEL